MPLVRLNSGAEFESNLGSSILEAAAKSNITLPYSCKTGRCSTCKCKVLSGKTRSLHPETGLSDQDKAEGWILNCVRSAETDLVLEVDDLGGVNLPLIKTLPCRISYLKRLTPNVIQVKLRLPPTASFTYLPGQYIEVIGTNGIRRSYSLANSPNVEKMLELHIRAVEGGAMSEYWFNQAKLNDLLRLNGPLGTFFMRDTTDFDVIFLATGTGIAPVKSMLESMADRPADQQPRSITVLWGGRTPQDVYLDVARIPVKHKFVPVLSRADSEWSGVRGYVQQALLSLQPNLNNAVVYACGSDAMIYSAKDLLIRKGLPIKRFYSDAFVCSSSQ